MKLTEKTLDTKRYFEGRIINLREDTVELEDGTLASREIVEHPGGKLLCILGGSAGQTEIC